MIPKVLGITLLAAVLIAVLGPDPAAAGFMTAWLSIWSFGCYALAVKVLGAWRTVASAGGILQTGGALYITLFSLPFFGGLLFGLGFLAQSVSMPGAVLLAALLVVNLAFYDLLKAPTRLGRRRLLRRWRWRRQRLVATAR